MPILKKNKEVIHSRMIGALVIFIIQRIITFFLSHFFLLPSSLQSSINRKNINKRKSSEEPHSTILVLSAWLFSKTHTPLSQTLGFIEQKIEGEILAAFRTYHVNQKNWKGEIKCISLSEFWHSSISKRP